MAKISVKTNTEYIRTANENVEIIDFHKRVPVEKHKEKKLTPNGGSLNL